MHQVLYDMIKDDNVNLKTGNYRLINKDKYEDIGFFLDITTRCNKNCNFCSYKKNPGRDISDDMIDKVRAYFNSILYFYTGNIKITLFGGEPTVHPKCYNIVDCFRSLDHKWFKFDINLQSNFSQSVDYYLKLLDKLDHLILTWHIDQQNDEFYNKFELLSKKSGNKRRNIEVFVMFDNFSFQSSYNWKLKLDDIGLYSELHFIKTDNNDIYPLADIIWKVDSKNYDKENTILINNHVFGYEEWFDRIFPYKMPKIDCYSGYQQQYIDIDGNIYRCDTKHLKGESFGNVVDTRPPFKLCLECENETCHRDWHVRKELKIETRN